MDDSGDRLYCKLLPGSGGSRLSHIPYWFFHLPFEWRGSRFGHSMDEDTRSHNHWLLKTDNDFPVTEKQVPLHGFIDCQLKVISSSQLKRINARYAIGVLLYMSTTSSSSDFDHSSLHPAVIPLTRQFEFIFQECQKFPSKRDTEHMIHLLPEAGPVNIWPYRFSHFKNKKLNA